MSVHGRTPFEAYLDQHDDRAWAAVLDRLEPEIHEVDRAATRIWFHFHPVDLAVALEEADDPEELEEELLIEGDVHLRDRIDSSHTFVYGHRWWPEVKEIVAAVAGSEEAPGSLDLAELVTDVADRAAAETSTDRPLLLGISAVGLMTLQQVGLPAFAEVPGEVHLPDEVREQSPEEVIARRNRDKPKGMFAFLKGLRREYEVTFDETDPDTYSFDVIYAQHLTTGARDGSADYPEVNPRCKHDEGPIPVQCRSAACGTCWVGVLGGNDNLSEVEDLERRRIRTFGYIHSDEERPVIRLACQAKAYGNAAIVLPPWNGIFGKFLRERRQGKVEEETSA